MESEALTEVPATLKRLVRYIAGGFYGKEHAIVIDLLIIHPCVKEDDILELLKFERKQLRALINTLKQDKLLKARMRVETDAEGKATRHNYYFINYSLFVNVVKYKLDHMRRKIETEQRDSANRSSYKCPSCEKTFTDLEADQLLDMVTKLFLCTYCKCEVEEQVSKETRTDSKSLMVKYNEQLQPLFALLKEVEDIKLSQSILEPEPVDIRNIRPTTQKAGTSGDKEMWSSKKMEYNMQQNEVTVNMETDQVGGDAAKKDVRPVKERPVWMTESTVEGAVTEENPMDAASANYAPATDTPDTSTSKNNEDIMKTLLAHEKKASKPVISGIPASEDEGGSSSESDDEVSKPAASTLGQAEFRGSSHVAAMESDDEDDERMVTVEGQQYPYSEVTNDMVARMSAQEKETYIRIGQEMYNEMYD